MATGGRDGEGPDAGAGRVIAGRYRLITPLGEGAFGEVWDAEDLVLGDRVALKRLRHAGPETAQTRREIATLRLLRFPGVVRLLDEGEHEGQPFFVTERVSGAPFPGFGPGADASAPTQETSPGSTAGWSATVDEGSEMGAVAGGAVAVGSPARGSIPTSGGHRYAWPEIAGVTVALLHTLRRVHAAGIVHRDLKPANVLVRPDGQPVVLDFGLSVPTAEGARLPLDGVIQGTPAYISPEQLRGGPVDARADLYAVGVMIYEALTHSMPHDAAKVGVLLALRASSRAVPVRARDPSIPADVADVVDRLLATEPGGRPASAVEVLERLRGPGAPPGVAGVAGAAVWSTLAGEGPHDEAALRGIFTGRDRLFHLRQDAAAALHARTGGDPARLRAEIERWIDAGIARCDDGKLLVDRDALDRWAAGLSPLAGGEAAARPEGAAAGALLRAGRWAEEGRLGLAAAALEDGLVWARRLGGSSAAEEAALLTESVKVAFAELRPHALDRVLYEVCRAQDRASPEVSRLEGLLRAAVASTAQAALSRGADAAAALEPFADPALERWRHWIAIRGRMFVSPDAATEALAAAEAWAARAGEAVARAAVAGFRGTISYSSGRFAEAAHWHGQAAGEERWLTLRLAQTLNEAAALLEACEPARAREVATRAAMMAAACRHAHFEGRAEWTVRAAAYRAGAPLTPDLELVEAHADLGIPDSLGTTCLTEAAIALRAGDRAAAAALATRAADTWQRGGQRYPAMLARALAGAAGSGLPEHEAAALAALAVRCPVPGIGIQALGLLRSACPALPAPAPEVIASLCAEVPPGRWADRMDVLSVDEARAALGDPRAPAWR